MRVRKIHHIAIIASNYEVSKAFYADILGLEVLSEYYREARDSYKLDLALNDEYCIELFSFPNPPKRPTYPEASGLRHIAFEVDDVEKSVAELAQKNVKVTEVSIDEYTGKKMAFFFDPDELPLELYEVTKSTKK